MDEKRLAHEATQDDDRRRWCATPECREDVRRSERWELEVDDDDAWLVPGHGGRQPTSIVHLRDDGMAGLFQEALQTMADQMLVIREYEFHYR
jgi:hypothetical protein